MHYGSTETDRTGQPDMRLGLKTNPLPSDISDEPTPYAGFRASAIVCDGRGMRGSILGKGFVDQIGDPDARKKATVLAQGVPMQALAFFSFVCFSGVTPMLLRSTYVRQPDGTLKPPYLNTMPYVLDFALSIIIGNIIALACGGCQGIKQCWNIKGILAFCPIMMFSAPSEILQGFIVKYLDGTSWRMMKQLKLPMTALALRFIIGRRTFNATQWVLISAVCVSVGGYATASSAAAASTKKGGEFSWTGVQLALLSIFLTTIGGVFGDVAYKTVNFPIYVQIAQGRITACTISLILAAVVAYYEGKMSLFPFGGYGVRILLFSPWLTLKDWTGSYVLKHLDSLWKSLAGVLSICVSYCLDLLIEGKKWSLIPPIFIVCTMINILAYAFTKRDQAQLELLRKGQYKSM